MNSNKAVSADELKAILADHAKWLQNPMKGKCADLRDADLSIADLRYANLRYANLGDADLRYANLRYANLGDANLGDANLSSAYLRYANLRGAYLRYANLGDADLSSANLGDADLRYANLSSADLRYANLRGADLRGADLSSADLRYANLSSADLSSADLPPFQIVPQEGSFIAFKKVRGAVLKLEIPAEAKRTSALPGRKCRAEKVRVLEAVSGDSAATVFRGLREPNTVYRVGELVEADSFDPDIRVECTHGIHFFVTREEAEAFTI